LFYKRGGVLPGGGGGVGRRKDGCSGRQISRTLNGSVEVGREVVSTDLHDEYHKCVLCLIFKSQK
jgi:hypothetical protein